MPGSLWPHTCRVMFQLKYRIFLPRVVYQTENGRGSAQNLRSGRFNLEFRGHPPSIGGLLLSGRIALRSCRASVSSMLRRRPDTPAAMAEAAFGPHGCGRSFNCHTIRTIWNGAYPEEAPVQPP